MCDRNQGFFFFFSRHAQPPLGLWLRTLQCEWINILLRTLSIWFLLDHNALRFSLHLAESVLKEIHKTNAVWLFFFYLLLVARLRFSLVYLCIRFVFPATALHFLVRWISRLIALWSKGVYIPSLHFFCENNPEPRPFFFVNWQMKTSFSITIMGSYTSENNFNGQWRHESTGPMICTTLMCFPDLASDGSPLFSEPMFLLVWALCNASTYCMLTSRMSCVNYALCG